MELDGNRLKQLRTAFGYSLTEFANVTGVSKTTLHEIEVGKAKDCMGSTMCKIAHSLCVPVEFLYGIGQIHPHEFNRMSINLMKTFAHYNRAINSEVYASHHLHHKLQEPNK